MNPVDTIGQIQAGAKGRTRAGSALGMGSGAAIPTRIAPWLTSTVRPPKATLYFVEDRATAREHPSIEGARSPWYGRWNRDRKKTAEAPKTA
jgi:hypothetical protein